MNSISLGQYIPLESPVHSADPRAKLAAVTAALIWIFSVNDVIGFSACAVVFYFCVYLSKLPAKIFIKNLYGIKFLIIIAAAVQLFTGSWQDALKVSVRISLLVSFASLLPLTSSPMEIADALGKVFPQEVAVMTMAALRFIPLLSEEAERIKKAQLARGAQFDNGNLIKRIYAYFPVLIPLFVIVFKRADELSTAMEARCYRIGGQRTRLRPLVWKKIDSWVTVISICAIIWRVSYAI